MNGLPPSKWSPNCYTHQIMLEEISKLKEDKDWQYSTQGHYFFGDQPDIINFQGIDDN